jgi:hypothetical protein
MAPPAVAMRLPYLARSAPCVALSPVKTMSMPYSSDVSDIENLASLLLFARAAASQN